MIRVVLLSLALLCVAPATAGAESGWQWPVPPPVVRPFDKPPQNWLPGHRGADLAAASASEVRAAGAGTVAFAGHVAGKPVVSIDHPNGLRTTYEPVAATVRKGQQVAAGEVIGTIGGGHEGCPVATCLHWGVRRGDEYLDPVALVGPRQIRLKPLQARG